MHSLEAIKRGLHDLLGQGSRQATVTISCAPRNDYDGRIGLRVSAIFVILIGSFFGKSCT